MVIKRIRWKVAECIFSKRFYILVMYIDYLFWHMLYTPTP